MQFIPFFLFYSRLTSLTRLGSLSDVCTTFILHSLSFPSLSTFILRSKHRLLSLLSYSSIYQSLYIISVLVGTPSLGLIDSSLGYPIDCNVSFGRKGLYLLLYFLFIQLSSGAELQSSLIYTSLYLSIFSSFHN